MSRLSRPARCAVTAAGLIAAAVTAAGCDGGPIGQNTPVSSGQSFVGSSYQSTIFKVGSRPAEPQVTGTTIAGQPLTLASYRGQVVVLNFWGSWCAPCRAEAPALGTLARQLYPSGVRFVGIDIRDEVPAAQAFMQSFGISYPSLNDPADEVALLFRATVPPAAIPSTIIVDRTGKIAARIVGSTSYASLKALISAVEHG